MKKKDLEKYLLPLMGFFLLATCLGIWLLGSLFIFTMDDVEYFIKYYKLSEWGIPVFGLKLLGITALVIASSAWFLLVVLVERSFNVHLFPNIFVALVNNYRVRTRPNLLKIISRKEKLSKDDRENKDNAK